MQTYKTIVAAPSLDNQAVLTPQLVVAMDASAARGDSAAQRAVQLRLPIGQLVIRVGGYFDNAMSVSYEFLVDPRPSSSWRTIATLCTSQ